MQKRILFGIVFIIVGLDYYIKQNLTKGHLAYAEKEEHCKHKLLQRIKKA